MPHSYVMPYPAAIQRTSIKQGNKEDAQEITTFLRRYFRESKADQLKEDVERKKTYFFADILKKKD